MSAKSALGSPPRATTSAYSGGAPKYIHDFTKALSGEVRVLLDEVGALRDERRRLQQEIAELMALKSKHGAGGEYARAWQPSETPSPAYEHPPPPAPYAEASPHEAPSGWRVVPPTKRPPAPAPAPAQAEPPASKPPAWAQWRPSPPLRGSTPQAPLAPLRTSPPPRMGLFGPSTPPP